jgi:hypothetical protein
MQSSILFISDVSDAPRLAVGSGYLVKKYPA